MAAGHFQSSTLRKIHWDLRNMLFFLTYVTMGLNKGPTMFSCSFSTGDSHDICMTKCLFKAAIGFLQQGKSHFHCKINPQKTVIKIKVQGSTTFANKLSIDFAFFLPSNHGVIQPSSSGMGFLSKELQPWTLAPMRARMHAGRPVWAWNGWCMRLAKWFMPGVSVESRGQWLRYHLSHDNMVVKFIALAFHPLCYSCFEENRWG